MARGSSANSGSSQFYINVADNSASLDGQYTVFGYVLDGMNVATQISNVPVNSASVPTPLVYMTGVTIVNSY
jgi:peptidyl-prolyl cis-trans isomerase B (cyclophilin B)